MANTPTVYVICDQNCKFEGMTKEQILTAIIQAIETGTISNVDAGFVTTIKTINNIALKFFVGEQAAYDELSEEQKNNLFAIITNDATKDALLKAIDDIIKGNTEVGWAKNARTALRDQNGAEIIMDQRLKVPDYPTMKEDATEFWFPLGTLFTVITGATDLKMYKEITTNLNLNLNESGWEVVYNGAPPDGESIIGIGGTWLVIGKCGSETVKINGYETTFYYYLITKVAN